MVATGSAVHITDVELALLLGTEFKRGHRDAAPVVLLKEPIGNHDTSRGSGRVSNHNPVVPEEQPERPYLGLNVYLRSCSLLSTCLKLSELLCRTLLPLRRLPRLTERSDLVRAGSADGFAESMDFSYDRP